MRRKCRVEVTTGPNMVVSRLNLFGLSGEFWNLALAHALLGEAVCFPSLFSRRAADNPFPCWGVEGMGGAAAGSLRSPVKMSTVSQLLYQLRKQSCLRICPA